ncbi:MAG: glutathione synthase [Chloroflexota bacterium]
MTIKLGMVMDPIEKTKTYKDSSFAMLLAAQKRGWELNYMEMGDLYVNDGQAFGRMKTLSVVDQEKDFFTFHENYDRPLADLDVIIQRKDPPFDLEYVYSTYMLELAETQGTLIVNKPQSLRDANEKMFTAVFPQTTPPTLITRNADQIKAFLTEHQDIIIKPLDMMGGSSIFRITADSPNVNVIIETLTERGEIYTMVQRYVPDVVDTGDKRILLIDGEPVGYALARMPTKGETRANMAAGGKGIAVEMTERDHWLAAQIGPKLKEMDLIFVGLDVIGDYVTEINVTSPTGIREVDQQKGTDIAGMLMDAIEKRVERRE